MKKRIGLMLVLIVTFLSTSVLGAELPAFPSTEGVVISEVVTGETVYEQNQNQKYYPASITKLLTALVAVEDGILTEEVTVGDEIEDIDADSSVAGLKIGEKLTLNDLIYGLLLPSGNDAANTIAVHVGRKLSGNEEMPKDQAIAVFLEKMNKRAKDLGMNDSNFMNTHGLHNENHYSTPGDLLKLGKAALGNETIKKVTRTPKFKLQTNSEEHSWNNSNLMLYPTYNDIPERARGEVPEEGNKNPYYTAYATGGKTGFTEEAGKCLIFEGEGNGKDVIGIILNADNENVFVESSQSLNAVVDSYEFIYWTKENNEYSKVSIENASVIGEQTIDLKTNDPVMSLVPKSGVNNYTEKILWNKSLVKETDKGFEITGDISKGTEIGELEISNNGVPVKSVPLYTSNTIEITKWYDVFITYWYLILIGVILLVGIILFVIVTKKKGSKKPKPPVKRNNKKSNKKQTQVNPSSNPEVLKTKMKAKKEASEDLIQTSINPKVPEENLEEELTLGKKVLEEEWAKMTTAAKNPEIVKSTPTKIQEPEVEKSPIDKEDPLAEIRYLLEASKKKMENQQHKND